MKVKFRIIVTVVLLSFFYQMSVCQVTDVEKSLRTLPADSTRGWKKGGVFSINLAQTSLTNWAAGGQNSFAVNGLLSTYANYKRGKSVWANSLDMGYGLLKQGSTGYRKTDDKFDLLSKYGYEAFKKFYYSALVNFKTQMAPGYTYNDALSTKTKISDLFAPAYLLAALGLDYKPSDHFSAFIAPLTGKITFVEDKQLSDAGDFGVKPGQKSFSEFGGYLRAVYTKNNYKKDFLKNVTFTTKVDLFTNYIKNPQNVVVNWETLLAFKVNKFLSANINTQLVYDDKIKIPVLRNGVATSVGSLIQFKEILGVGFAYTFKSFNN
ncbi:MAG: DUF3078 domain-containing protein [Bacteroidales bacterium]